MISINRTSDMHLCELGGGSRPVVNPKCLGGNDIHIDARMCTNHEGKQCVDAVHNLVQFPWPSKDNEFDGVIAIFVLEHVSYLQTLNFLKEAFRITKPGGKAVFVVPNTENQVKWILEHQSGWDGKDFFTSASEKLFGSQDDTVKEQEVHVGSYHCVYFNPLIVNNLFEQVGYENILCSPYGERETDLAIQANKPSNSVVNTNAAVAQIPQEHQFSNLKVGEGTPITDQVGVSNGKPPAAPSYSGPNKVDLTTEERANLFARNYFDQYPGSRLGFHWDVPYHEITARKILEKKPESVLELGCSRGYIIKRLEDVGIRCTGFDISKHAYLTKVSSRVFQQDVLVGLPCIQLDKDYDLCFSISFLEHVPEDLLPIVVGEMERTCKRGLHGITFLGQEQYPDSTRCTLRSKEWWQSKLPKDHEVVSVQNLENGVLPDDYVNGDGRTKLSIGTAWTMAHYGWQNIDMIDAAGFAGQYRYNFKRLDACKGLPYGTGIVDLIFSSHMLEHLTYAEGLSFLRECRRVIRPDGGMRLIVPNAEYLMDEYTKRSSVFDDFGEVNTNCAIATTSAGKLWALLHEGHASCYDGETLCKMLGEAGWESIVSQFRFSQIPSVRQILKETCEMSYGFSLFVDAIPIRG